MCGGGGEKGVAAGVRCAWVFEQWRGGLIGPALSRCTERHAQPDRHVEVIERRRRAHEGDVDAEREADRDRDRDKDKHRNTHTKT